MCRGRARLRVFSVNCKRFLVVLVECCVFEMNFDQDLGVSRWLLFLKKMRQKGLVVVLTNDL